MSTMEPEVTVLEAARIVGVHPESVKRWIRYGELHAEKQGILYFIKRKDLDAFRLMRQELDEVKQRDYRAYWATPQGAFVDRIGEQLDGLLENQPLCVIGLEPGGCLYAEHLARYLAVVKGRNPAVLRLPTGDTAEIEATIRAAKEKLKGRKLLLVDDDTCTGDTYKTVTSILFTLARELGFEEFFIKDLAEYFEIIVSPFLTGQIEDFELVQAAKRIPLAVYTDNKAIASFFVRRPHIKHNF
ncbi:MAG: helix-turn-helix domain-containing protein [Methanomicrobia archaeon]|nr:helix-turn-helix domain-containing protein [Methanomicrobia archaeon]